MWILLLALLVCLREEYIVQKWFSQSDRPKPTVVFVAPPIPQSPVQKDVEPVRKRWTVRTSGSVSVWNPKKGRWEEVYRDAEKTYTMEQPHDQTADPDVP